MGALYIHPIPEARMKRSGMTNLRMFKEVVGMEKMKNVRLVTTKWTHEPRGNFEAHETQLATSREYWKPLLDRGATIVRFGDSWQSAMEIIRPLVNGHSFLPLLTKQVNEGLTVPDTNAGVVITDKADEARRAGEKALTDLNAEWEQAVRNKELDWAKELDVERKKAAQDLKKAVDETNRLRAMREAGPSSGSGRIGRWAARIGAAVGGVIVTAATFGAAAPAAVALYGAVEAGAQVHERFIDGK